MMRFTEREAHEESANQAPCPEKNQEHALLSAALLAPGVRAAGPGVFIEREQALVLADLHLGADEGSPSRELRSRLSEGLASLFSQLRPKMIILAGDVKHSFGAGPPAERQDVVRFLRFLHARAALRVVLGNHDRQLALLLRDAALPIPLEESVRVGEALIVHGDKAPAASAARPASVVVSGHEHPAVRLSDGVRAELVKCFLVGETLLQGRTSIVLPAANPLIVGSDVLQEEPLGALVHSFSPYTVWALLGDAFGAPCVPFGTVRELRQLQRVEE